MEVVRDRDLVDAAQGVDLIRPECLWGMSLFKSVVLMHLILRRRRCPVTNDAGCQLRARDVAYSA